MLENNFLCSLECLSFYFLHILAYKRFYWQSWPFFKNIFNNNIAKARMANFGGPGCIQK